MTEHGVLMLFLGFGAGIGLAALYLWHLRRAVSALALAPRPALNLAGQMLVRLVAVGAAFALITAFAGAPATAGALAGFVVARTVVVRRVRRSAPSQRAS